MNLDLVTGDSPKSKLEERHSSLLSAVQAQQEKNYAHAKDLGKCSVHAVSNLEAGMAVQVRISFLCGLRGYRLIGTHEVLPARHEHDNTYDQYAIAILPGQLSGSIVGHLPKEIARFTRFIIVQGLGGLEIYQFKSRWKWSSQRRINCPW